jgi:hypothetical protein
MLAFLAILACAQANKPSLRVLVVGDSYAERFLPKNIPGWDVTQCAKGGASLDEILRAIEFVYPIKSFDRIIVVAGMAAYSKGLSPLEIEEKKSRIARRLHERFGIEPEVVPLTAMFALLDTKYAIPGTGHIVPEGYPLLFHIARIDFPIKPAAADIELISEK